MTATTTVPKSGDPAFLEFQRTLLAHPVRPAKRLAPSNYHNHGQVLKVSVNASFQYPKDHCWFNCLEHCLSNEGTIVFGWGLWQRGPEHFVAQHHAIWSHQEYGFQDFTPNDYSDTVLFMPDNRAPFDFHGLRCPFNFERRGRERDVWVASGGVEADRFSIAALVPTEGQALRISHLQRLAIARGLI